MKKIFLFLILVFFIEFSQAQIQNGINYCLGIVCSDSCTFENTFLDGEVIHPDTSGLWQIANSQKTFFDTVYAIMTDSSQPYTINKNSFFQLDIPLSNPPYACSGGNIVISFDHKFETDSLNDRCFLTESTDGGVTWVNIINDNNAYGAENFYHQIDTLDFFSGTSTGWVNSKFQWIWFWPVLAPPHSPGGIETRSQTFPIDNILHLRFNFQTDSIQTNKAGWVIDNLKVFDVNEGSGIAEVNTKDYPVSISQNPFSNSLEMFFSLRNFEKIKCFKIYDLTGKEIFVSEKNLNQISINTENWQSGFYFYKAITENGKILTGKLLKQ